MSTLQARIESVRATETDTTEARPSYTQTIAAFFTGLILSGLLAFAVATDPALISWANPI
jgi:hypothetical protein